MRRFADLYTQLDASSATGVKLAVLRVYFSDLGVAEIDRAWALWLLLGNRLKRLIPPGRLRTWIGEYTGYSPALIEEAYAQVGDLAETLALLIDTRADTRAAHADEDLPLSQWIARLRSLEGLAEAQQKPLVFAAWDVLSRQSCYLLNKLLTGSLRVGVSTGLAARALAESAALDPPLVMQRLAGDWQPSAERWQALLAPPGSDPGRGAQPYPFCLASPLEDAPESLGEAGDFLAEWKWDGIRAQLVRRDGHTWIWSRGEELLHGPGQSRFPELDAIAETLPDGTVIDGEILAWRDARVLPFALLQKRINRKLVGRKMLADAPLTLIAYDLLEWQGEDWRTRFLRERRAQLEALSEASGGRLRVSPRLLAESWDALVQFRDQARDRSVEGLMLKRLDSPYTGGRKRGAWWKWKIGALTVDTVLVYAQAGHGRRANLYTDYTLAVWQEGALVPVAKAYSGLTDAELLELDRWIRSHTREKFGPVRSVDPQQVFEIAFEGIQASPRHKAGAALRFPRIARWRRDKPAAEADSLDNLKALLSKPPA